MLRLFKGYIYLGKNKDMYDSIYVKVCILFYKLRRGIFNCCFIFKVLMFLIVL